MRANIPQTNVVATDARLPERKGLNVFHENADIPTVDVPPRTNGEGNASHNQMSRGAAAMGVRARINSATLAIFLMVTLAMTMVFAMPNAVWADEAGDDANIEQTEQSAEQSGEGEESVEQTDEADNSTTEEDANEILLSDEVIMPLAAGDETVVVDGDTTNAWQQIISPDGQLSTQNIGRIWTDKTVLSGDYSLSGAASGTIAKGDSDFLVALSALASTSNLRTTTTTAEPLDIVLVLDESGSMANSFGGGLIETYVEVNSRDVVISTGHTETDEYYDGWWPFGEYVEYQHAIQDTYGGEYYALVNGEYVQIKEITERVYGERNTSYVQHVRWELNGQTVTPEDTQFYTIKEEWQQSTTRRAALQQALYNFIGQAEATNATIANDSDKIRVAIVGFAGNAETHNELTVVEGNGAEQLERTVRGLGASGATNAGAGMSNARSILENSNRPNSREIVIFFTDGVPTTSNTFNTNVANTAVSNASWIKNNQSNPGTVYSIGIFDDANPDVHQASNNSSESTKANTFMNAVSSNYPSASSWNQLGQRVNDEAAYYKTADDSTQLNQIFQDIFDESTENVGSGSPIEEVEVEGAANTPGYLTFTDELGDYMEVSGDTMSLVFADQIYTGTSSDGGTTWSFQGGTIENPNPVYPEGDVSDIIVTVSKGSDLATGDTVTVSIPASLIPMRNYNVDTETGTMSVSDAYPVRVFYGVSLKDDARAALADPSSDAYAAIVAAMGNDKQGNNDTAVEFLSNYWSGNATLGDTTATFTPNSANRFYYFTENTPLYVDDTFTTRATRSDIQSGQTVYYEDTYWVEGVNREVSYPVALTSGSAELANVDYSSSSGEAYLPVGTQHTSKISGLEIVKGQGNATYTAADALNPTWATGTSVSQRLGNNGKLTVELPGMLTVTKTATVEEGSTGPVDGEGASTLDDVSFNFTLALSGAPQPAEGEDPITFVGKVMKLVDGNLAQQGDDIVFASTGGDFSLKNGETLYVYGLSAGMTYTVTESAEMPAGFTQTAPVENEQPTAAMGTITAGGTAVAAFENTYKAEPVSLTGAGISLQAQKVLDGRDWRDTDSFKFDIVANGDAPIPEQDASVTVVDGDENHTKAFGDIEFTAAGIYTYTVTEDNDVEEPIPGIDYSGESYTVTIDVVDDGEGHLTIPADGVTIQKTADKDGNDLETPETVNGTTMVFTNEYDASQGTTNINGTKVYDDTSGDNPIFDGMFTFQLEALGGYETNGGSADNYTIAAADVPMPNGVPAGTTVTTTTNDDHSFSFPTITFTSEDVDHTFEYRVTEVGGTEAKMTYSDQEYTLKIVVTDREDNGQMTVVATPNMTPQELSFTNTYDPTDATLKGDTAIQGVKVLTGRDMLLDEVYTFTLVPTDATLDAIDDNYISGITADGLSQTVSGAVKDAETVFAFDPEGGITFNRAGKYTFTMKETAGSLDGMSYDTHECTVTVTVELEKDADGSNTGRLVASVDYGTTGEGDAQRDGNVFINSYTSSMEYGAAGGINVTKQLKGRNLQAGEFAFTIDGVASDTVTAEEAEGRLADADREFTNPNGAGDSAVVVMSKLQGLSFTQTDAGKTFNFEVKETKGNLAAIDYADEVYTVSIQVIDNNDGTMHTVTTVSNGDQDVSGPVDSANVGSEGYTPATVPFVNTYNPEPAVVPSDTTEGIKVTKQVNGASTDVDFGFTLKLVNGDATQVAGLDQNNEIKVTVSDNFADGDSYEAAFGKLTFSKVGVYTFQVTEDLAHDGIDDPAGWTYDDSVETITVTVRNWNDQQQYDGVLHAYINGNNPWFTNSYKADPAIVGDGDGNGDLQVTKQVSGAPALSEFEFTLAFVADSENENAGSIENVKVGSGDNAAAFPQDGITLSTDELFDEATNTGVAGTDVVDFGQLSFTEEGVYTFTVTENTTTDEAGWTYDNTAPKTITVTVTDEGNDGQLDAVVTGNGQTFNNSYIPNSVTATGDDLGLKVTKQVSGAAATEEFGFSLTLTSGDADGVKVGSDESVTDLPADKTITTATQKMTGTEGSQTVGFGDLTFTKAGDYEFTIDETTTTTAAGWTYDASTKTVTVHVTDEGFDGQLDIAVEGGIEGNNPTFYNTYYNPDDAKDVTSDNGSDGSFAGVDDTLTYTIDWVNNAVDENGVPQPAVVTITDVVPTGTIINEATISDDGKYDSAKRTITWTLGSKDEPLQPGAAGTVSFEVTVTEDAVSAGQIENMAEVKIGDNDPKQTNKVVTDTAQKESAPAEGDTDGIQVGDVLTYTIDYKNTADEDGTVTVTDTLPASLTYMGVPEGAEAPTQEGQTLTWTIENVAAGQDGTIIFTAKVNENAVTVAVDNTAVIKVGENEYTTNTTTDGTIGTGELDITKTVVAEQGASIDTEKEFTFEVTLTGTDGQPLTGTYPYEIDEAEAQDLSFADGSATVTLKHGQTVKITGLPYGVGYVVTENEPGSGYTPASEGANGIISDAVATAAFTNTYEPGTVGYDPTGEFGVKVNKEVTGNGAGDQMSPAGYTFSIAVQNITEGAEANSGFSLPEGTVGTSNSEGIVSFNNNITFDTVGTYQVTITENAGDNENITYDSHALVFNVNVTDAGQGILNAAVVDGSVQGSATFTNVYYNPDDAKDVTTDKGDGSMAGVGDTLTYTVDWANNAVDENGQPTTATVTVTDVVPAGTTLVDGSVTSTVEPTSQTVKNGVITWTFADQLFGAAGTVSFQVTVDNAAGGTTVTNSADVYVNDAQVTTNPVETVIPGKTATDPTPDEGIQVGDVLDYTITWANTTGETQDVTVVDTLPAGLTYVGVTGETDEPVVNGQELTWVFEDVAAGTSGTITFQARVNENATTVIDPVKNQATVTVGDNSYKTNTTGEGDKPEVGSLVISKTVVPAPGTEINVDQTFEFTVHVVDAFDNPLNGQYTSDVRFANGSTAAEIVVFENGTAIPNIMLHSGDSYRIQGLPVGSTYTVTETPVAGYTQTSPVDEAGAAAGATGTIAAGAEATAAFANTYTPESETLEGAANLTVTKKISGRDWAENDSFAFTLTADLDDPATSEAWEAGYITLPENAAGLTIDNTTVNENGDHTASFGDITFSAAGRFQFYISEDASKLPPAVACAEPQLVVVSVDDNKDGTLTATVIEGANPTITNVYDPEDGTLDGNANLTVTKSIAGRDWLASDSFTFVLAADANDKETAEAIEDGSITMPENAGNLVVSSSTVNEEGEHAAAFGSIVFSKAGDYQFTVTELPSGLASVTDDEHSVRTLKVHVADMGEGKLVASLSEGSDNLAFVNTYKASTGEDGSAVIKGTKSIDGRAMDEGDVFTFNLSSGGTVVATAVNDADGNFTFKIPYTEQDLADGYTLTEDNLRTKTITYTVSEVNGGDTIDGVLYDATSYEVTVTLTDDGKGHIDAQVGYPAGFENGLAFENTYTGSDVTSQVIAVGKTLVGRDMAEGEFSFELHAYDPTTGTMGDKVASTTNDAAANGVRGNVAFGALSYTADMLDGAASKTFYYAVTEVEGTDENITYNQNGNVFYAGVTVNNDGQGNLSSTVTYYTDATCTTAIEDASQAPCFVNAYTPDSIQVPVTGFKSTSTVDAAPLPENLTFGYEIVNVNDPAERYVGTSPANGAIDAAITVDGTGTFTYRITEVNGGTTTGGITYDDAVYYLVIDVTTNVSTGAYEYTTRYFLGDPNNGGVPVDAMSFNNVYGDEVGATLDLSANKTLSGATFEQLSPFGFTVTETTNGMDKVVATGTTNGASGTTAEVDLSTISYSFRVEQPDEPVVDEGETTPDEQQPAEGETTEGEQGTEGTTPEQPAEGTEPGTDQPGTETGGATEPEQPAGGAGETTQPDQPAEGETTEPGGAGEVVEPPAAGGETGEVVEPVEPVVPETPVEETPAEPEVTEESAAPEAPAEGDVAAASIADLSSPSEAIADDVDAEVYTGAVVDETAAAAADETAPVIDETAPVVSETAPAAETETAPAAALEPRVVSSDLGLHTYVISENIPSGAVQNDDGTYTYEGVTYDSHSYVVTVDVQAPYDAATQTVTMTATIKSIDCYDVFGNVIPETVAGSDGCDNVTFANSYYASTPAKLGGTDIQASKTLTGRDMADKEFSFTIVAAADNPDGTTAGTTVAVGTSTAAKANEASAISFGELTFSKPGTYYFSLTEDNAGDTVNGVTYSTAAFEFSVTVTDNYDGTLSATVNYPEGGMAFTNAYKVNTSTSVTFAGTKTLVGRDMADKEFSFTVTELMPDGTSELVAGGQNAAAGDREASAITFAPIKYTEPGEHDYVIAEVNGGTEKDGVTYDATVFNAHVSVTDNLDGTMSTAVTYSVGDVPCDAIAFENVYSNDGATATVTPEASKTLTGRDMKDGEFAFVVTDQATGKVVSNGRNTADGTVAFDAITLTTEGDYEFVISEVNNRQDGVTYDDATFRMLVSATDDGKGGLSAEVSYPDGKPAFANSYKEPEKPKPAEPEVPKTGDDGMNLAGAAALGLGGLGAVLVGGGVLLRRRASR